MSEVCPRSAVYFEAAVIGEDGKTVNRFRKALPCNSWSCPVCAPRKARKVRYRALNGGLMEVVKSKSGYRFNPYSAKMITLTCPGKEFRARYDPSEAEEIMKGDLNRLRTRLWKEYGKDFEYLLVVEPQKDGYPHFHIMFCGQAVIPKGFYWFIRRVWNDELGQGYVYVSGPKNTNGKFASPEHAVRYITKYLLKGMVSLRKYSRVFTSSRRALKPMPKTDRLYLYKKVIFNRPRGGLGLPLFDYTISYNACLPPPHVLKALTLKLRKKLYPDLLFV